ncbi:MAG: hypothetical protein AAF578_00340 [Pseudomonadota bacterium]
MDDETIANLVMGTEDSGEPQEQPQEPQQELEADELEIEETEEPEGQPEFAEIEWEGQLYDIPVALQEAFMKNGDYTRKTQELSLARDTHDASVANLEQMRAQYEFAQQAQPDVLRASQIDAQIEQYHEYLRTNVHQLGSGDIERVRLEIDTLNRDKEKIVSELRGKAAEFQQAQQQSKQELLNQGTEVLKKHIPGWGQEKMGQLREYALNNGFTAQEIDNVIDPKQVLTLYKASQYDALQKGKSKAVQRVKSAPKKARPMPKQTQDNLNLRKKLKNPNLSQTDRTKAAEAMAANILGLK